MADGHGRCGTCFREQRWRDGQVEVVQEGGARRPPEPVWAATWRALAPWARGEVTIVGTCSACGQPLVGTGDDAAPWTVETPGGALVVSRGAVRGPDGELTVDAADAWVTEQAKVPFVRRLIREAPAIPFAIAVVVMLVIGVFAWAWAGSFFFTFVWQGMENEGFTSMPGAR